MLNQKSTRIILLALIFLSFFGTLTLSAWTFPQRYDWRYRVVSNLLSPRDNPNHYRLASIGLILTGFLLLPFPGYLRQYLRTTTPRAATLCAVSFVAGIGALICAAVIVPQHRHEVLRVRRMHELLARSAAGFFAIAMLSACWGAWKKRKSDRLAARLFLIWSTITLMPLAAIFASECLLLLTRLEPSMAQPIRNALRHSVLWHLGFWEWTGSVAIFLFLCTIALFAFPQPGEDSTAQSNNA